MDQSKNQINLTINEMVAAYALCGYEHVASQLLNEHQLVENEDEFNRLMQQAELFLKNRGYWDDERDTKLVSGLESLIHLLAQCSLKVRCVKMKKRDVMFLHYINHENLISQRVLGDRFEFQFHESPFPLSELIQPFYKIDDQEIKELNIQQSIEISDEIFDQINQLDSTLINQMLENPQLDAQFKIFLEDFLKNNLVFDNFSLIETNYVKDESTFDQINFFIPSEGYSWHIDYTEIEEQKVYLTPVDNTNYLQDICDAIMEFFESQSLTRS